MRLPRRPRLRRPSASWRFTFVSACLVVTMVLAAVAAYQLHASIREHQRSVDRMLVEYASYTSQVFGDALMRRGLAFRLEALAAPTAIAAAGPGDAMPLAYFMEHAARAVREDGHADDPWLGYFRLDLGTREFHGSGSLSRPALAGEVASLVGDLLDRDADLEPTGLARHFHRGEPLTIIYDLQRTRAGVPVAAFGLVVSRRHGAATSVETIMRHHPLTPPSLVSPGLPYGASMANDSILSVEFFDHRGNLLYRSPRPYQSKVQGEYVFNTVPGGFTIRSTLSPGLVERIRAAHHRDARWSYAFLLPLVSLILGASAIVHLLRERELVRERRDFIASVSHELRTPLAQIQLFAETLLRGRERSDEERRRWLGVISREAYRMGGLVENILMFSQVERTELRLAREPTNLAGLIDDVLDTFEPRIRAHEAHVVAEVPPDLVVDVDPRAVRQVFGNLLDNALKYGPGRQTIRIAALPTSPECVLLSISDQGPGIPAAERFSVWLPFRRLTHQGGSSGGSGLGLAVVRSLIAQHGGNAFVDDAPGGGARFVVTLPRAETPGPQPTTRPGAAVGLG